MASIETLPAELVSKIVKQLHPFDRTTLARVSKHLSKFALDALWSNIELHRHYAHQHVTGLKQQQDRERVFLEKRTLIRPWWLDNLGSDAEVGFREQMELDYKDQELILRNSQFNTVIRKLYQAAGRGKRWAKIAPSVRHLCMTVNHLSAPCIWNAILSLPNIRTIELIAEHNLPEGNQDPPSFIPSKRSSTVPQNIQSIRLRGYIPESFVATMLAKSAHSVTCLDIGVLEPPYRLDDDDDDDDDDDEEHEDNESSTSTMFRFMCPSGILWFHDMAHPQFAFLTHLLLCKRGNFLWPPMSSWDGLPTDTVPEDPDKVILELDEWAQIIKCVSETLVHLELEQRPLTEDVLILPPQVIPRQGMSLGDPFDVIPNASTEFNERSPSDALFFHELMEIVFKDAKDWPKLKQLTFRGINFVDFEEDMGMKLKDWVANKLPDVKLKEDWGCYMYWNSNSGTIRNENGVDGLLPNIRLMDWLGSDGWL